MNTKKCNVIVWMLSLVLMLGGFMNVPVLTSHAAASDGAGANLEVHFIDVGQADCILAKSGGSAMLIDAGNNDDADTIISYLENQGIQNLKYVIGTHPHEDHIGSMDSVIEHFNVENVIMPDKAHTSKTFEDVLTAIDEKGLQVTIPEPGQKYELGSASFTVLAPVRDYGDELNDWSVGIRLTNGDNSFIMCGDAEAEAEQDIIAGQQDIASNVYKVDHHGSDTSSTAEFLDAVNPEYAVISCGTGNTYGHPTLSTLEKLRDRNIQVFRTDEQGTVVAVSDGKDITWSTSPSTSMVPGEAKQDGNGEGAGADGQNTGDGDKDGTSQEVPGAAVTEASGTDDGGQSIIVHITKTGEKYHSAGCQYLKKSDIEISLEDAKARGLSPCSKCSPPQ